MALGLDRRASAAHVITASWPVVVIVGPEHWDSGWVDALDRELQKVAARKAPYALITDTRPISNLPGAKERKVLTDWLTRPDQLEMQKTWNVGSSTIIKNALMRGSLQALYWLWTPPSPQHVSKDLDDAWAWCIEMLAARSVPLPNPSGELLAIARRELPR